MAICVSRLALAGQAGAAVRVPGAQRELEAAVVAVAGVDRPVAAGLALREAVPDGVAAGEVGGHHLAVPTLTIAGDRPPRTFWLSTLRTTRWPLRKVIS